MELFKVDLLEEAQEKLLSFMARIPVREETVPLTKAYGLLLAQEITAPEDVPKFSRSAVDGYAVIASDTYGASDTIPTFLTLVEEVFMGQPAKASIEHGQCAYVPTGGMIPKGADAMVMVEYCEYPSPSVVAVRQAVAVGKDIVHRGDDMKEGSVVLQNGILLRPQEIASLAALGIDCVQVRKPYRVSILSTGDELTAVNRKPKKGQIRESNSYCIRGQAIRAGMDVVCVKTYPDDEEALEQGIRSAMENSDFVFLSGGSSKGKKDLTARLLDRLSGGGVYTHGLALKPGKPTILGWDEKTHTILAGLPGHPSAAAIVFELLFARTMRKMQGRMLEPCVTAKVTHNVASAPGRGTCVPVTLRQGADGIEAEPVLGRSGSWSILVKADGYFLLDHNREGINTGETVHVYLF